MDFHRPIAANLLLTLQSPAFVNSIHQAVQHFVGEASSRPVDILRSDRRAGLQFIALFNFLSWPSIGVLKRLETLALPFLI